MEDTECVVPEGTRLLPRTGEFGKILHHRTELAQ